MSHDGPIRREKRGCQKRGYVLRTVIAESQRDPSRAEAAAAEWGGDGLEAVMVKRTTSQLKKEKDPTATKDGSPSAVEAAVSEPRGTSSGSARSKHEAAFGGGGLGDM
eukprot:714409-Prorocentrum_minimum.AAC.1